MKRGKFPATFLAVIWMLPFSFSFVFAVTPDSSSSKRVIFIDPGHGGDDPGTRGPGSTLEKEITLQLAHLIADKLAGDYQLKLSRTDDVSMDLFNRTGMANGISANLFLSLHVGGRFRPGPSGFSVYHYDIPAKLEYNTRFSSERSVEMANDKEPWRGIQLKHLTHSRQLSRFIMNRLRQFSDEPVFLTGADIMVLSGANMPAVLIEIGCLTNPQDEKKIKNIGYLKKMADVISSGVKDFFGDNSSIPSMDLRQ